MTEPKLPENADELAIDILNLTITRSALWLRRPVSLGQFVVTGPIYPRRAVHCQIGYCVQIRTGAGQFGSDVVFLRHADGILTTHENQSYTLVPDEHVHLAQNLFTMLPEDEDFSQGFACTEGIREYGFIIEQ